RGGFQRLLLRRRSAEPAVVYETRGVSRTCSAGSIVEWRSRAHCSVATRGSGTADAGAAAGPVAKTPNGRIDDAFTFPVSFRSRTVFESEIENGNDLNGINADVNLEATWIS